MSISLKLFAFLALLTSSFLAHANPKPRPIDIILSGADGESGSDGRSYPTATLGRDGRRGGDASPSTPGAHSDSADVVLARSVITGQLVVTGQRQSRRKKKGAQTLSYEGLSVRDTRIRISATGGDGGDGGNGGDGQPGSRGEDGRNATQSHRGTDGEDGFDGGDGGNGTSGSNGGDGGRIRIVVSEADADLLMLVAGLDAPEISALVAGGRGGRAGSNGRGGAGGDGGDGGRSHSWVTYRTVTNGKDTRTVADYHSNPGGRSGRRGHRGSDGVARLSSGTDGQDGEVILQLKGEDGSVREYPSRYQLKLVEAELVSENRDGIIEPGELVQVRLTVQNVGGMPIPSLTPATLFVRENSDVLQPSSALQLPGIASGEIVTLPEPITVRIRDVEIQKEGVHIRRAFLETGASMPKVEVEFSSFSNPSEFEVRFPIEIRSFVAPDSIGQGESVKISLELSNVSTRPFGLDTKNPRDFSVVRRALSAAISRIGGTSEQAEFEFVDSAGGLHRLSGDSGINTAIERIAAGQSVLIEGTLNAGYGSSPYQTLDLGAVLGLGRVDAPWTIRRAQQERITLRFAQAYHHSPSASVLVIAHKDTEPAQLERIGQFLRERSLQYDVWDVSYYGFLSLEQALRDGGNLLRHYRGGTIIFLNSEMDFAGTRIRPTELLDPSEFQTAMHDYDINFLLVGDGSNPIESELSTLITPALLEVSESAPASDTPRWETQEDFFENLERIQSSGSALPEQMMVRAVQTRLWGRPNASDLNEIAREIHTELRARFPSQRFIVLPKFNPAWVRAHHEQGEIRLFNRWIAGQIEIREASTPIGGTGVSITDEGAGLQELEQGFHVAARFRQNLQTLEAVIMQGRPEDITQFERVVDSIVTGLIHDLIREQNRLRVAGRNRAFSTSQIEEHLPHLRSLIERPIIAQDLSPERAWIVEQALIKLYATLHVFSKSHASFFERALDLTLVRRRNPRVSRVTERFLEQWLRIQFGSTRTTPEFKAQLETEIEELNRKIQNVERRGLFRTRDEIQRALRLDLGLDSILSLEEALSSVELDLIDSNALEEVRETHRERTSSRNRALEAHRAQRASHVLGSARDICADAFKVRVPSSSRGPYRESELAEEVVRPSQRLRAREADTGE